MFRWLILLSTMPLVVLAHDPGLSTITVDLQAREILVQAVYAVADFPVRSPAARAALAERSVELRRGGQLLAATAVQVRENTDDFVEFSHRFARPAGLVTLSSPLLAQLPLGHRQMLTLRDESGATTATALLRADQRSYSLPAPVGGFWKSPVSAAALLFVAAVCVGGWLWHTRKKGPLIEASEPALVRH